VKKPHKKPTKQALRTRENQQLAAADFHFEAVFHYQHGRPAEAENAARHVLRIAPGHPAATVLLAELLVRTARHREIAGIAREAVRRHPNDPALFFVLADASLAIGDLTEARRAVDRFHELMERGLGRFGERRRDLLQRGRQMRREVERRLGAGSAPAVQTQVPSPPKAAAHVPRSAMPSLFDDPKPAERRSRIARTTSDRPAARLDATPETAPPASSAPIEIATPARRAVAIHVEKDGGEIARTVESLLSDGASDEIEALELVLESHRILLLSQYEDLLCLPALVGVERHEYQIETARKILRRLSGRALLCDEVGLGKTIEAGMVIKEYLLRALVRSVLILVPPGLVEQWRDEMSRKFGLEFEVKLTADTWAATPQLVIASMAFARHGRNSGAFTDREWDLVVVDEAHHLRRRTTRSWALVNALQKRYLLLLSATPVHNDLMELYELVTLVKPGLLGTPPEFRRRFLQGKDGAGVRDTEKIRALLAEVMVRNTRSNADIVLPKRFASTLRVQPHAGEAAAYRAASAYARLAFPEAAMPERFWLRHVLACAGSGTRALADAAARRLGRRPSLAGMIDAAPAEEPNLQGATVTPESDDGRRLLLEILHSAESTASSSKADRFVQMLAANDEQVVVFCRHRVTLSELSERLSAEGVGHVVYHGGLSRAQKDDAIAKFAGGVRVLLSTESGGEGRNLHFCRTLVNYDLPWDPMLIEQRIGRLHRIGQRRDVFVFNLVVAGTLEEELIRILEEKIHLFELVVGEVDSILGHLKHEQEFAEILLDLWAGALDDDQRRARFETFGVELDAARAAYEAEKALGDALLADDLEA
jgi:superfamily II DNA or RNA helicase